MEYMACGKPVIASYTSGHRDILTPENAICLKDLREFRIMGAKGTLLGRWQEPSLDELVAQIEFAYHHREEMRKIGIQAGEDLKHYSWKNTARQLIRLMALD
jgi:glycosyltransferase involved in cell wall biosynthesis